MFFWIKLVCISISPWVINHISHLTAYTFIDPLSKRVIDSILPVLNPLYSTNRLQGSKHLASAVISGTHSTRLCWWPRAKHWARYWCRLKDQDGVPRMQGAGPVKTGEISSHPLKKAPKEANFSCYCIGLITGNSLKAGTCLKIPGSHSDVPHAPHSPVSTTRSFLFYS